MSRRAGAGAHRVSTAHLQAAYPFVSEGGLGGRGVYIGRELLGGAFCYDPWDLYAQGTLTNPNMLVAGQVGRGKSSFIKTYLWRQQVFGRHAWIIDPKGEYGPLAAACGVEPVRLGPGLPVRLNPLDTGAWSQALDDVEVTRRHLSLLNSLAAASLGRALTPDEQAACEAAIVTASARADGVLTLPAVVETLLWPDEAAAARIAADVDSLAASGRQVALELRRLCQGDLAGMFDGPTTPGLQLDGPLVVLDLSALYGSPALGLVMLCATAWLQASLVAHADRRLILVIDEAWAILRHLEIARWLQASWKLSRQYGVANVAVIHRLSDLRAAGAEGSEQAALAQGLLADSETRVIYGQSSSETAQARELLGLTDVEAEILPELGRGIALWRVGTRSFLAEHHIGSRERALVDTDARMS
ncbi:MAG: type IV secretion system DNA-binding domain-containing protein [Actinobacteria bacterium]|jgi:type IV secretory pathway VirB4 component|nr:type IV secretion system DNA-binding domain-containing protein [Actinomycetota bacterium]